ncbi:hypothetical protein PAPYR_4303 [Paratrimastix pyriformis]|uniref:Uncharacterized protein n=1 Tax=Paratrimastix pyriformis TaxID=342808 RepID=A0ABQ8UK27_9EUKA|nr:hypothetical protein PAPYR_4303 [Paratrimastix pyriformis]
MRQRTCCVPPDLIVTTVNPAKKPSGYNAVHLDKVRSQLLSHCTAIDLSQLPPAEHSIISDSTLAALLRQYTSIAHLHLSDTPNLTNEGLVRLMAARGGSLRSLDVSRCGHITSEALLAGARHCPCLEEFAGAECALADAALVALAQWCPLLAALRVAGCDQLTDGALLALGARCPRLRVLDIRRCPLITARGLQCIHASCPALAIVQLCGTAVSPAALGQTLAPGVPEAEPLALALPVGAGGCGASHDDGILPPAVSVPAPRPVPEGSFPSAMAALEQPAPRQLRASSAPWEAQTTASWKLQASAPEWEQDDPRGWLPCLGGDPGPPPENHP